MKKIMIDKGSYKRVKGSKIATIRKRVTKRSTRFFSYNLHNKILNTMLLGGVALKTSIRDLRTIRKFKFFELFLLNSKNRSLTDELLVLKNKCLKIFEKELKIENISSALSYKKAPETMEKISNYLEKLYVPKIFH